ncbi:MAG: class I SAM-dependent methyltransferase [Proteobacteria bacterium]|nr:class I SAM-dependent methyltransferase [Pseudomonadota bacterium]
MKGKPKTTAVSAMDQAHLALIRKQAAAFWQRAAETCLSFPGRILEIAPQEHGGLRPLLPPRLKVETLDIDPLAGATHTGDLCRRNEAIEDGAFDCIVCTEVLEHTLQPFDAMAELHRMLAEGGLLFLSVPFNFRIHGPLPDCWRFTEHGLRVLLADFRILELEALETPDRPLMPVHYTVLARKPERRSHG